MRRLESFALVMLALAVLAGCATKKKETAQPKKDGMAAPATSPMGKLEAGAARLESEKAYLVAEFMKLGDDARERADWAEAQKNYQKVVRIDPDNDTARKRLDEANSVLGIRPSELRDAMDSAISEREVRRQQAQTEITDLVKRGELMEKQSDYAGAIRAYEKARLIVGLYPYYGDFDPNDATLKDMISRATARKVEDEKARDAAEKREAQRIREIEEQRIRQAREARIAALFRDSNLAMERTQYDLAREYAEQILRLDPVNETAAKLVRLAREMKLSTNEMKARRDLREQWRNAFEDLDRSALPQTREVIFPEEWMRVQANRSGASFARGLAKGDADPRTREIKNLLATTVVNINFDETELGEAVSFLSNLSNVNIIVLPSVGEEKSEEELLVTLKADNISVENALELITLTRGLSYRIAKGVVQIGTESEAMGEAVLDLYDVKDLTVPIKSFPGEDINLVPSGGFGFGFDEMEEAEPTPAFDGDSLADLVRDTIDPEVWDEGGDVQFKEGGILIVKAPVDTHRKVQQLLDGLRASGGLTVSLEARFITVEDSFLQDIGIDVRGLGDNSGGLGLRGKGQTRNFDDVLFGSASSPTGIGTGQESGVFYNLNSDGDVRGRVENLLDVALGRSGLLTAAGGASIQATYLDDTQAEVVLRAVEKSVRSTVVVAPKITVYNQERANVTVLNQVSYIQDFDVEIAQAAQIGDPIVQTLRDGVILDVTPIVSADRKYVTLELRPTVAILKRPIATFQTTLANGPPVIIQLPELRIQRVRTTVTMPDGGILLLGGLKFFEEERMESSVPWLNKVPILSFFLSRKGTFVSKRNLIILIKAKILVMEEMEPRFGGR